MDNCNPSRAAMHCYATSKGQADWIGPDRQLIKSLYIECGQDIEAGIGISHSKVTQKVKTQFSTLCGRTAKFSCYLVYNICDLMPPACGRHVPVSISGSR